MKLYIVMGRHILFCLILWTALPCMAQSKKPLLSKYQTNLFTYKNKPEQGFIIDSAELFYCSYLNSVVHYAVLFDPLTHNRASFNNHAYHYRPHLSIINSSFRDTSILSYVNDFIYLDSGAFINNCNFNGPLILRNLGSSPGGFLDVYDNESKGASVHTCRFENIYIMFNKFKDNLSIRNTVSLVFVFDGNLFIGTRRDLNINNSKFSNYTYLTEGLLDTTRLNNDTFSGKLYLQSILYTNSAELNEFDSYNTSLRWKKLVFISECYIDATSTILNDDSRYTSKFIFETCSFGRQASLFNVKTDTLIFRNCTDIQGQLFLTADSVNKPVNIEIVNSNVTNLRFDYNDKFNLFFEAGVSDETRNNTYQSLVAKFKAEGKPESLEKIDVEYKEWQYGKTRWLRWAGRADKYWWYYGYKKWLIIGYTLGFLLVFYLFNYLVWNGMRTAYGMFQNDNTRPLAEQNYYLRRNKFTQVLVFTTFIFFSLRIDFDKLKYASNRYVMAFFVQYIAGLVCLFFLVNAIFKLG